MIDLSRSMTNDEYTAQGKKDYEPLPLGEYLCEVEDVTFDTVKSLLTFKYRVIEGAHKNRRLWDNVSVPKVAWKLKSILTALGMDLPPTMKLDESRCIGKRVKIAVKHDKYNGKTTTKPDSYYSVGSNGGNKKIDEMGIKELWAYADAKGIPISHLDLNDVSAVANYIKKEIGSQ